MSKATLMTWCPRVVGVAVTAERSSASKDDDAKIAEPTRPVRRRVGAGERRSLSVRRQKTARQRQSRWDGVSRRGRSRGSIRAGDTQTDVRTHLDIAAASATFRFWIDCRVCARAERRWKASSVTRRGVGVGLVPRSGARSLSARPTDERRSAGTTSAFLQARRTSGAAPPMARRSEGSTGDLTWFVDETRAAVVNRGRQ
jgi:hypothetical protein